MTTLPYDTFTALVDRIRGLGFDPNDFDTFGMLDSLLDVGMVGEDAPGVGAVSDVDFLRLLARHDRQVETGLPCPDWCQRPAGHGFECDLDDDRQSRPHEARLPGTQPSGAAEPIYMVLSREDIRNRGDDATVVPGRTEVQFAVDAGFQADGLRRLTADLLNAADELEKITGARSGWTEDQL